MAIIKQISVFLENKEGRLSLVTKTLADNNVNIRALSVADTTEFGILRMIVNEPDSAYNCLKQAGFAVRQTQVIAVEVPDSPGGLYKVLQVLQDADINLEYAYAFFTSGPNTAVNVMRVEQGKEDAAVAILGQNEIKVLNSDDLAKL